MNERAEKAFRQAEQIQTYRRDAEGFTAEAANQIGHLEQAIKDQTRALERGKVGEAQYHAKRIAQYAEKVGYWLDQAQIKIAEANGRDPF